MKVICVRSKGSKFLVKGQEYEVVYFSPKSNSNGYSYNSNVRLKGVGTDLNGDRFEMLNGTSLSEYNKRINKSINIYVSKNKIIQKSVIMLNLPMIGKI